MQTWKWIAVTTLWTGLTTLPTFGTEFEPLSVPELARRLGVGFGPGYHARPCGTLRAMYYDCVTQGATPFGHSDLSLESYDHTHPNIAWRFPIDGQCGCDACQGKEDNSTQNMSTLDEPVDQDATIVEANVEDETTTTGEDEVLTPPTGSVGQQPNDSVPTDDEIRFLPPKTRSETVPDATSPSPSDESTYILPPFQSSYRWPPARPQSHQPQRLASQARVAQRPRHPDPVWVRNLATRPTHPEPRPAPVYVQQTQPANPPQKILDPLRIPPFLRKLSQPPRPTRTANSPADFLWH